MAVSTTQNAIDSESGLEHTHRLIRPVRSGADAYSTQSKDDSELEMQKHSISTKFHGIYSLMKKVMFPDYPDRLRS